MPRKQATALLRQQSRPGRCGVMHANFPKRVRGSLRQIAS